MAFPAVSYITPDDYLEIEVRSLEKHEYFEGRIYDMAGASFDHNFIVANLMRKIGNYLEGKECEILVADLRVTTPDFDSFMYPDLTILCEELQRKENGFDTLTNPTAIIEVMSSSTKGYDMAFKFHYYKQIPSLKEYILVDSTRKFIQINRRKNETTWDEPIYAEDGNSSLVIDSIGFDLPLNEVYRKTSLA